MDWKNDPAYYGKILIGHYSQPLKERVAQCISGNREFEDTGNPAICYLAAWHEKDRIIWYEFAGKRLSELLGCESWQVAQVFRHSVVERSIYKYQAEEPEKLVLALQEALSKVKQLSGLLPICASCKKIRDDQGYWNQIEEFVVGAEFATGLRQIIEAEVTTFLDLSLLKNPIFMDDQAAQAVGHPQRILPAPLLISVAMGLCQQRGLFDRMVMERKPRF